MRRFARRALLAVAAAAVALPATTAHAYEVWIDLNTYNKSRQGSDAVAQSARFAGADGVWLITFSSGGDKNVGNNVDGVRSGIDSTGANGFSLGDWQTIVSNIAGPDARIATEDNPSNTAQAVAAANESLRDAKKIIGGTGYSIVDSLKYNETGIDPAGGTVLSDAQITSIAPAFDNKLGALTRSYVSGGSNGNWKTETDRAIANAGVQSLTMETTDLDGQNVANFLKAVRGADKTAYLLIGRSNTSQNIPGLYYLKQQAPAEMASGGVRFVLNNDYTSNSANSYGFFGAGDTVEGAQDFLARSRRRSPSRPGSGRRSPATGRRNRTGRSARPRSR